MRKVVGGRVCVCVFVGVEVEEMRMEMAGGRREVYNEQENKQIN